MTVDARGTLETEEGAYQTATVSMRVRAADLLYHCVPGFNWSTAIA